MDNILVIAVIIFVGILLFGPHTKSKKKTDKRDDRRGEDGKGGEGKK